jgi:hypothetical protein
MICVKSNTGATCVKLLNYDKLQQRENYDQHAPNTRSTRDQHAPNNIIRSKEVKKERIEEQIDSVSMRSRAFTRPTLQEILGYFIELGSTAEEANKFFDHYTANGWKVGKNAMKDWKATARNWNRNKNNFRNSNGTQKRTLGDREVEIDYQKLFADSNEWLRKRGIESSIGGLGQGNGFALGDGSQNQD